MATEAEIREMERTKVRCNQMERLGCANVITENGSGEKLVKREE